MNLYLSWGILPYLSFTFFVLGLVYLGFQAVKLIPEAPKTIRRWLKAMVLLLAVFLLQFPWHHSSTPYLQKRLTFNKGVEYTEQQIERKEQQETWEERSQRLREEARTSANARSIQAMEKTTEEGDK